MIGWLAEIESWAKVLGLVIGVVMAILVPVRSWIVEDRRYRADMLKAAATAGQTVTAAVATPSPSGSLLADAVAMEGLIHAVRDCAAAIREGTKAESDLKNDALARAIERFMDHYAVDQGRPKPETPAAAGRPRR